MERFIALLTFYEPMDINKYNRLETRRRIEQNTPTYKVQINTIPRQQHLHKKW